MRKQMRKILVIIAFLFAGVSAAGAQTINAASCSQHDVVVALGSVAADTTTVVIPSGSCSWGTTTAFSSGSASVDANGSVTYNQVFSTIVQGATIVTCTGTPGASGYSCPATDN